MPGDNSMPEDGSSVFDKADIYTMARQVTEITKIRDESLITSPRHMSISRPIGGATEDLEETRAAMLEFHIKEPHAEHVPIHLLVVYSAKCLSNLMKLIPDVAPFILSPARTFPEALPIRATLMCAEKAHPSPPKGPTSP
ncbi:hypothetical protein HAX54_033451 [Datura stramonium]|uniref:Uncharacterized protein n=1 Tax=Datura stramonium TaxID=4076 RepID=A0ABS8VFC8_DATST|nr:hypothetical protein [Datura stramonium]